MHMSRHAIRHSASRYQTRTHTRTHAAPCHPNGGDQSCWQRRSPGRCMGERRGQQPAGAAATASGKRARWGGVGTPVMGGAIGRSEDTEQGSRRRHEAVAASARAISAGTGLHDAEMVVRAGSCGAGGGRGGQGAGGAGREERAAEVGQLRTAGRCEW